MFDGYLNEPADLIDGYFPTGDLETSTKRAAFSSPGGSNC